MSGLLNLVCTKVAPPIGVTRFVKQGPCQIAESPEIRQKPNFERRGKHLKLANRW
jgi:hypothetical protein